MVVRRECVLLLLPLPLLLLLHVRHALLRVHVRVGLWGAGGRDVDFLRQPNDLLEGLWGSEKVVRSERLRTGSELVGSFALGREVSTVSSIGMAVSGSSSVIDVSSIPSMPGRAGVCSVAWQDGACMPERPSAALLNPKLGP